MPLKQLLSSYQARVEHALDTWLPPESSNPPHLHRAMRYATLNGGKRVRPVLVYATGKALGIAPEMLDAPACAVECIHAYSLVHDDLPAMDDDALRRGKPTCHIAFDEATAILAGDALQALAFQILSDAPELEVSARRRVQMVSCLAEASGSHGMVGGQAVDMAAMGQALSLEQLEAMHRWKTGALIRASVRLGALASEATGEEQLQRLDDYAATIGLAFQIRDDILDVEADTETLGKPQGSDKDRNKPTYTALLGLEGAKAKARECHAQAEAALAGFGAEADPLRWLSAYIVERAH